MRELTIKKKEIFYLENHKIDERKFYLLKCSLGYYIAIKVRNNDYIFTSLDNISIWSNNKFESLEALILECVSCDETLFEFDTKRELISFLYNA